LPAPAPRACRVWVPIANRVEKTALIVVGEIVSMDENKYTVDLPRWPADPRGDVTRKRRLHDATLRVTEILKGTPEHMETELSAEGDTTRTLRLLFDGH
jgi:hypothetical protein